MPDRPTHQGINFYPYLPEAIRQPVEGGDVFARLVGAEIIRIGTTDPGMFEGGGLIIDYCHTGQMARRLVLAFSELGMWVESDSQFLSA